MTQAFVDFQQVWLAYNDELLAAGDFAVEDITLSTEPGEFIAIVGPSGCGKSTFMKLATGLKMPTRGTIHIDSQPVTGPLKIVGMAFQAPTLLPWRTTIDNVLLPLEIVEPYRSQYKARRAEYAERARKLLATVGLQGYEDKYPWQLSGGMQQRASICRALIHEPRMLLLDEPFGALDAFTREELWNVLRDLWSVQRFNVILVTHDLREAVYLADKVLVFSRRPARVALELPVALPAPRHQALRFTAAFSDVERRAIALTNDARLWVKAQVARAKRPDGASVSGRDASLVSLLKQQDRNFHTELEPSKERDRPREVTREPVLDEHLVPIDRAAERAYGVGVERIVRVADDQADVVLEVLGHARPARVDNTLLVDDGLEALSGVVALVALMGGGRTGDGRGEHQG